MKKLKRKLFFGFTIIGGLLALGIYAYQIENIKLSTLTGSDQVYCAYPIKTPGYFHAGTKCPKLKGDNFNLSLSSVLDRDYLPCPDCFEIDTNLDAIRLKISEEEKRKASQERIIEKTSYWVRDTETQSSWSNDATTPLETLTYSDDFIKIAFAVEYREIRFDIQNKTYSGIKINWDDLSMIYSSGKASRVIHSGVRLIDRNNPQASTMIPPNAKVSDILIPSENITYTLGKYGGWDYRSLFKEDNSQTLDNKKFSIYFPLEIKGEKKEYIFKFKMIASLSGKGMILTRNHVVFIVESFSRLDKIIF
jgi:hypothetical protein